jgi:solute carrier family 25 protein 34/35
MGSSLQLQGELQAKNEAVKKYKGPVHGVKVILQNEGPRGLFRGIGSAVSDRSGPLKFNPSS